jgi:hypothetical protein
MKTLYKDLLHTLSLFFKGSCKCNKNNDNYIIQKNMLRTKKLRFAEFFLELVDGIDAPLRTASRSDLWLPGHPRALAEKMCPYTFFLYARALSGSIPSLIPETQKPGS